MASNSTITYIPDPTTPTPTPTTPNTTFVQADPSNFRAVVQKLTGASDHPSTPKLPLSHHHLPSSSRQTSTSATKKPLFKLHERRNHTAKKLEHLTIASSSPSSLSLSDRNIMMLNLMNMNIVSPSSVSPYVRMNKMMVVSSSSSSPVSPLDAAARGSPRSPPSQHVVEEEEERVIAEKGFYLRPISSPLGTPRGSDPPELLPLFPLHSPNSTRHQEQP